MTTLVAIMLVATPVLAFAGGIAGHLLTRKSATELDRWRKREETMRMLRWATELAINADPTKARAGLLVLDALLDSPLLDHADVTLVATVTQYVATGELDDPGGRD